MKTLKSEQNVILTESLNKLWQTAVQLEQSTNIHQELDAIEAVTTNAWKKLKGSEDTVEDNTDNV